LPVSNPKGCHPGLTGWLTGNVLWSPFGLWQMSNMGAIRKMPLKDVQMKYIKIKLNWRLYAAFENRKTKQINNVNQRRRNRTKTKSTNTQRTFI